MVSGNRYRLPTPATGVSLGLVTMAALASCGGSTPAATAAATATAVPTAAPVAANCAAPYTGPPAEGGLTGVAYDAGVSGRQTIANATIGVFAPNSSTPITTSTGDAFGDFNFYVAPGTYVLAVIVGPGAGSPETIEAQISASCVTTTVLLVNTTPGSPNNSASASPSGSPPAGSAGLGATPAVSQSAVPVPS